MDRSRLPSRMGIIHFIARLIALALSYASLTLAFYLACTHALLNPVLYTTLIWCLVVDSAEVLYLITKPEDGIGRVPTWLMLANETLVISLFIVGWVVGGGMMVDVREEGLWKRRLWLCVLSEVVTRIAVVVVMMVDEARVRRRARGRFGASRGRGRWRTVSDIVREAGRIYG